MTANATTIARKIAEIVDTSADFAALRTIFIGLPYSVPNAEHPYASIILDAEYTVGETTGNYVVRRYEGAFVAAFQMQDLPEAVAGRRKEIPSYTQTQEMADAFVRTFKSEANCTLGDLAVSGGRVLRVVVGDDTVEYGVAHGEERADARYNFCIVPFAVETMERM